MANPVEATPALFEAAQKPVEVTPPLQLPLPRPPEYAVAAVTAEARTPTLEEAKESGAPLMLPPIVEYGLAIESEIVSTETERDPTVMAWPFEAALSDELEADATDQLLRHITIEEVLAVSGLLSNEEDETPAPTSAGLLFVAPETPLFAPTEQRFAEAEPLTPEQIFDHFAEGLLALAPSASLELAAPRAEAAGRTENRAPMTVAVTERLLALEPEKKEVAMPIVQQLTEAIAEVRTLQTALASTVEVAKAEERVAELSVALLEAIGVEYDEESLQQFVQRLLRPDFLPELTKTAEEIDLERMGTHEVKLHFPKFFTTLADVFADMPVRYLLGRFALFCESFTAEWPEHVRVGSGGVAA